MKTTPTTRPAASAWTRGRSSIAPMPSVQGTGLSATGAAYGARPADQASFVAGARVATLAHDGPPPRGLPR